MSHEGGSLTSIFLALGANFLIAVTKLVAALITGSGSMLAEAVHSFADCGNQGLLLFGLKQAKRKPSFEHPMGYGKAVYFWSFVVALMLFSVGGLFSVYEGVHKLSSHEPLSRPGIAIGILFFSVVLESISLLGCLKAIRKIRGKQSLRHWVRHTRRSELLVVLGEDVAALCGLTAALAAVVLSVVTGNVIYDAFGSIVIGVLLIAVASFIGYTIQGFLIGASVEHETYEEIESFLTSRPEVRQVLHLIALHMGRDVMMAVKVRMNETADAQKLIEEVNACEAAVRERFPQIKWSFFEPDITD